MGTVKDEVTVIGILADRSPGAMTANRFFSDSIEPLLRRIALVAQDRPDASPTRLLSTPSSAR